MRSSWFWRPVVLALTLSFAASGAFAQTESPVFEPKVGQQGKDVIWVPTPQALVDKMLDMAHLTSADYLIDLGSGDGRTVITAAKRGARALGIEYNPDMVALSTRNALAEGVSDRAQFIKADLFETDFSKANVITMFLLPSINLKLRPAILELKPGTRIVSNTFTMGEWTADQQENVTSGCSTYCNALLWIVPAKVEGTWRLADGTLELKQEFQKIAGTLKTRKGEFPVEGQLRGNQIEFKAGEEYTGVVDGDSMAGTDGSRAAWSATHVGQ